MSVLAIKAIAALIAVITIVTGCFIVYDKIYDRGYSAASTVYQARIDKLVGDYAAAKSEQDERVAAISDAQKAEEARTIASMQMDVDLLQNQIKEQAHAASIDPNAKSGGIGVDSVRRVNSVH